MKRRFCMLLLCVLLGLGGCTTGGSGEGAESDAEGSALHQGTQSPEGSASADLASEASVASAEPNSGAEDPGVERDPAPEGGPETAPANWVQGMETRDLDGRTLTWADLSGERLTVLNIWATWCPPCVAELPELQAVSERFAGVASIVGVLQDGLDREGKEDPQVIGDAQSLLADAGAVYPVILPDQGIQDHLIAEMQYFPTTFFINTQGEVIHSAVGSRTAAEWEDEIEKVLESLSETEEGG